MPLADPDEEDQAMTMQTISELLRHEKETSGLSYRDLVARASVAGYSFKFQTLNDLVISGPKSWPKNPNTFRALAAILRTNEKAVVLAYAAGLGLDVSESTSALANRLPAGTDKLSPSMQDALIAVVRAAIQEDAAHDDDSDTQPETNNVHQLRPASKDARPGEKSKLSDPESTVTPSRPETAAAREHGEFENGDGND